MTGEPVAGNEVPVPLARSRPAYGFALWLVALACVGGAAWFLHREHQALRRRASGLDALSRSEPSPEFALAELRKACAVLGDDLETLRGIGAACEKLGDVEGAIAAYRVVAPADASGGAYLSLGALLRRSGNHAEVVEIFRKAGEIRKTRAALAWVLLDPGPGADPRAEEAWSILAAELGPASPHNINRVASEIASVATPSRVNAVLPAAAAKAHAAGLIDAQTRGRAEELARLLLVAPGEKQ